MNQVRKVMQAITRLSKRNLGFTMAEMIAVVGVIAILMAMLIVKTFDVIHKSKITVTVASCNKLKAAVDAHCSEWGKFTDSTGVNILSSPVEAADFDTAVLLVEGRIDVGFYAKTGSQTQKAKVQVVVPGNCNGGAGYDLDGDGEAEIKADTFADAVIEVIIYEVPVADALEMSKQIDDIDMSAADIDSSDANGCVNYTEPDSDSGEVTAYIYVAHR